MRNYESTQVSASEWNVSYQYETRTVLSPIEYLIWILGLFKYGV
jgi:hypothetical protein